MVQRTATVHQLQAYTKAHLDTLKRYSCSPGQAKKQSILGGDDDSKLRPAQCPSRLTINTQVRNSTSARYVTYLRHIAAYRLRRALYGRGCCPQSQVSVLWMHQLSACKHQTMIHSSSVGSSKQASNYAGSLVVYQRKVFGGKGDRSMTVRCYQGGCTSRPWAERNACKDEMPIQIYTHSVYSNNPEEIERTFDLRGRRAATKSHKVRPAVQ